MAKKSLKLALDALQQKARERTVKTDSMEYDLETLVKKLSKDHGTILLNPDYQRNQRWDDITSSRLIESLILNIPIPTIFLSKDVDVDDESEDIPRYSVIDGQQRLTAIKKFFNGELILTGLEILEDLNGTKYQNLPQFLRNRLEERTIKCLRIDSTLDAQLKFDIFERLNSGSVQLSEQELRNVVCRGPFNDKIKSLVTDVTFRLLLQIDPKKLDRDPKVRKMQDVEIALRYFALCDDNYLKFKSKWSQFLTNRMTENNERPEDEIEKSANLFLNTMSLIYEKLGENGFARYEMLEGKLKLKSRFNRAVFDALSTGVAAALKAKKSIPDSSWKNYQNLFGDQEFLAATTGTINHPPNIVTRIEKVRSIFN